MAHNGTYRAGLYYASAFKQRTTFNGKLIGCTETCFAIGANDSTFGTMRLTEQIVRSLSGEWPPDPNSPGLNQAQLVKVAKTLHLRYASGVGNQWSEMIAAFRQNRRVVAQLWYSEVGGGNIGHAFLLEELVTATTIRAVDPIFGVRKVYAASDIRAGMVLLSDKNNMPSNGLFYGQFGAVPYKAMGAT